MADKMDGLDFPVDYDLPIRYLDRIRTYYQTLGFGKPYRWAQYIDVPFTPLKKPLAESQITLITTAAPYQPDKGDQGPGAPYNAAAKFYKVYSDSTAGEPDVRISHIGIDRKHTTGEDINTWFPLKQLKRLEKEGRIGKLAERFHGAPTNRSQKTTIEQDCVELLARVREDGSDAVVIVAN
jgi:D-proline reductase (dithiol) PrdB